MRETHALCPAIGGIKKQKSRFDLSRKGRESLPHSRFDSLRSLSAIARSEEKVLSGSEPVEPVVEESFLMPYFVYILRTSSNTLYIGQTNNLKERVKEHKKKSSKSAKYIRYFPSFDLVYQEVYSTRAEAMHREAQLKKLSKAKKEALIKNDI